MKDIHKHSPASLSIVAPFFNEEQVVTLFYDALFSVLSDVDIPVDFVFVDDGSTDGTLAVLNDLSARDERVSVLSLARNFGHQIALTAGLDFAQGEIVITMDSDLQHPPDLIPQMLQAYTEGYHIVYGVRKVDAHRGYLKSFIARIFYAVLQKSTKINLLAGAVDFRLMSQQVVRVLTQMRETHRYLRGMVPWTGYPYTTVYYEQQKRAAGESKYSWRQLSQLAKHGLFSFSTVPLEVISWVGVAVTGLSVLYLIYVLISFFNENLHNNLPGWTTLIVLVLLVGGVQLISVGVLAQYIAMIFEEVKGRPLYTLKQLSLSTVTQLRLADANTKREVELL